MTAASCQRSAYETHADMLDAEASNMLDAADGMQMILLTIYYVHLVAGLHVQAREAHEK